MNVEGASACADKVDPEDLVISRLRSRLESQRLGPFITHATGAPRTPNCHASGARSESGPASNETTHPEIWFRQ